MNWVHAAYFGTPCTDCVLLSFALFFDGFDLLDDDSTNIDAQVQEEDED